MAADATESDDGPSPIPSRPVSRSASERKKKAPTKRLAEPARPAKVALLVWKISCTLLSRAAKRTQRKALQEALGRLAAQHLVKKVLATVAQWERHALKNCNWHGEGDPKPAQTNLHLGVGWWELPELENYPVSVADATAAMLHAIQFGGSKEYGGAITDLSSFVKEYVASCRLTCVIKRYTFEEKTARFKHRDELRQAFEEQEEARGNFEERAKVIASILGQKHADLKTFDALHHLATQRDKNFDVHISNSKTICDGYLSLQNVHVYQALGRIYPRLLALEKELEDTIQSVTGLADPGVEEAFGEEEEETKKEESPRARARRRKETMRRRKALLEQQRVNNGPGEETDQATSSRPALRFEDKAAHDKQLAALKENFHRVLLEYDLVPDADKSRIAHLYTLANQGQQKLDQYQDQLLKAEEDIEVLAHRTKEALRAESERKCWEMLRSGRLPTEMLGSLKKQSMDGPTTDDRDALKARTAALFSQIADRQKTTVEERDLQEELESLQQEIQEQEAVHVVEETQEAERIQTASVELPSLDAAFLPIRSSMEVCKRAMELASVEFVQLTTGAAKLERKAEAVAGNMASLLEGRPSEQVKGQVSEWQALCKDLLLDMEQVGDSIKVDGLPKGIADKVWMQKQAEIRGASRKKQEEAVEEKPKEKTSKKAAKQNAVTAKKQELKIEKEMQDKALRKKQIMLGIEMLWSQLPESEVAADAVSSHGSGVVSSPAPASPAGAGPSRAARPTLQTQKSKNQLNTVSPLERILQHHRADIAAGHERRNSLIKQIEELQQKLEELSPEAQEVLKKAEQGIAERKAAQAANRAVSPSGSAPTSTRAKSKPADRRITKSRASILQVGANGAEEDDGVLSDDSDPDEAREPMQLDPWMLLFPTDSPELGKKKWEFCKANRIKPHRLHDASRHKKYIFALRRMMKQCKRTLALKQKLLMKFLSGDELQKFKVHIQKSPQELEAEVDNEGRKLKERDAMIAKLLTFWHRRMQQLEDEKEAERETFRYKVKALLEDIQSLAKVLEDAALTKKRRRRVDADDLLTLRQQKAATAAAEAMKPRMSRVGEGSADIAHFQTMMSQRSGRRASAEQEAAEGDHRKQEKQERKRLAELLRKHLAQHRKSFEENAEKAEASDHSSSRSGSKSSEEAPEAEEQPGQRNSDPKIDAQGGDAGASSEGFVLMRRRKNSLKEPPVQTLSSLPMLAGVQKVEGARHRSSVAGTRMFGRPSSRMRGTAKRKSSVARKDSIFENPAAVSRRLTDDSARSAALAQVLQMAQASDAASADDEASKVIQASTERIRRKSEEEALLKAQLAGQQAVAPKPLQAPTDLPGSVSFHGHAFGRRTSQRPGTRKHEDGDSKRRKDSETSTPFVLGLLGTGSSQPGSRAASPEDSGPPSMAASRPPPAAKTRSASRIYQGRPSAAGLTLPLAKAEDGGRQPSAAGGKPGRRSKSPDHSRRSSGASEHDGDTGNEISDEEMRADLFLKATYLHLGAFRQHYLHPSLKGQRPSLSDAIMGENGEVLFRSLISQIVVLPSEMLRRAVRHFINTERARCLFIVKNSLIHQARLELEASQRTISILESDPDEVERQMKEGGPLFPTLKKAKECSATATAKDTKPSPSPSESSSDSNSDEEPEKPAGGIPPPSAQAVHRASIRGKLRRAGVHSFMAFAEGLHQLNRRPTRDHAIPGASDEMDAPMLQIRSVDGTRPPAAISAAANEASDHSAVTKTGSIKKRFGGSTTSTTLSDRLREAQLAADAASSRQGSHAASEKPLVSAMSLQTSMLKTMLKKPAVQDSKKQSSTMSLIGDYNWDKTLKKFDTLLRRGGLQNRSANQGYWESHFAYDVGPEGPLSSRLPDSEGRPLTAPGCRPIKHRPQPIKEEVEKTDESPGGSSPSKSASIPPATPADPEQPPPEPEEGEKRASKNAPLLLSLARFMTKVKAKKSKREKLEEFFYVAEEKAKWSRRPSKPRLLTQEMEEEWAELQDKVRMEKGKWIQHSRRKVEAMFQEEEFGENWDRQQRTLQRERNPRQQENIFDTLSFVRWKVNKQLRQAMQDVEKGNKVNLPRKQDRSAGPPPPDPVWIVGDREDSGLEKARERIATLRAKKYRGKPFMPMGQGRGWRVDQDLFDHVDELFQQYGEAAAINEEAVNPRAASEMVGAKQKARRASDSDSESGHSDSESSSALQRRVVSAPASMRRVQARRITRSRAKSRELSVLPPWMRQMLVQDDIWQQLPESSPWDRTCWLQPVRVKGRTATDRAMTPEQVAKALSRKSSRSDKPRRVAEDPVLFVRKACASIVEEYGEKAPEVAAPTVKQEEPARPGSPVAPDTETRHNRVMEILERDSLLTQEPLERVLEEPDEDESGTGSINVSLFAEAAGADLGPAHAEGDGLSKPPSSKDRLAQEIYAITSRPAKRQPPALSMQTLVFEIPGKEPTGTKGHRSGDMTHSLSTDASTESISSQDKAKAKPQRLLRGFGSPQRRKRDRTAVRRRKHSELDVVARKMVDLSLLENIGTEHRRRSLLHEAPPSSEPVQVEKPVAPAPPQMTVDIGKLSAVLAKQWSEVTAEEVQARRLGMQKLKEAKLAPKATVGETVEVIAVESLYEVDKAKAAQESDVRQSSKASALSDVSERKASKTNSLGNARMSRLNSMGATAGMSQSLLDVDVDLQAEDMAPAALQTHLTQWRSWRREGRLPSAPVHLPPAPIVQHPAKAAPVRQNSGSAAQPPAGLHLDISLPSRAINEYLKDFRDQDLDGLLEGISQTPADDFETNEFVWPPPKRSTERSRGAATAPPATKLPVVQGRGIAENMPSSTGQSWVRALTSRADSPAWLLDALDSRASSRTSRSYGDRASPPPDLYSDGRTADDEVARTLL